MKQGRTSKQIAKEILETQNKLNDLIHEGLDHPELLILDHKSTDHNIMLRKSDLHKYVRIRIAFWDKDIKMIPHLYK